MNHIGKEMYIQIDGKKYRLSRWTRTLEDDFKEWALRRIPDPIKEAKELMRVAPESVHEMIWKDAIEAKRRLPDEVEKLKDTYEGQQKQLCLMFSAHNPDLGEDDIEELLIQFAIENDLNPNDKEGSAEKVKHLILSASGQVKTTDLPSSVLKKNPSTEN